METLRLDVRHALLTMQRAPAMTLTVLLTLGLGIGTTTAVFSAVHGILLRPLPYPDSARLVRVWEEHPGGQALAGNRWLSWRTRRAWSEGSRTLEGLGAYATYDDTVRFGDEPSRMRVSVVSPSVFGLLRATPALGRFFTADEETTGAAPVAVLTDRLWRERFAADPAIVGRTIVVDEVRRTIVGVARAELAFPDPDVRLWIPYNVPADADAAGRTVVFTALGRLRPGVTAAQAETEGTAAARSTPRPPSAEFFLGRGGPTVVHARALADDVTLPVRPALLVLAAAVALVLLIACANVANLLLARGAARHRELAIRAALGGRRGRLIRHLLTESALLAAAGGALGLALAWALLRVLPLAAPAGVPRLADVTLDGPVIAFALAASLLAALVSGLAPALRSTRVDLVQALCGGEGSATASANTPGARRLRRSLLVVEAAFAVVLAVGASLLAHSFVRLTRVDPGYDSDRVLVARISLPEGDRLDVRTAALVDRLLERLRRTPGVTAAGAGNMLPLSPGTAMTAVTLPASAGGGKPTLARTVSYVVTPGYAEALRLRLIDGRFLNERDASSGERAVLVNQAFARQYLAGGSLTGLRLGRLHEGEGGAESVVAGVVGDVLKEGHDAAPQPAIYVVHGSRTDRIAGFVNVAVRTAADDPTLPAQLRQYIREIDPLAAVDRLAPLRTFVAASWDRPRFAAAVMTAFALLGMGLAGVGLYAALSYGVSQRRRELGVRAALGASRRQLVRLVLREGLAVTCGGVAIGVAAAGLLTRLMDRLLFATSPLDALAFTLGPVLLIAVGIAASTLPALRAASADPSAVLRGE
jgi:putative ABC transport system permease protein